MSNSLDLDVLRPRMRPPANWTYLEYLLKDFLFLMGPVSLRKSRCRSWRSHNTSPYLKPSWNTASVVSPINTSGWLNSEASDGRSLPTKGTASKRRARGTASKCFSVTTEPSASACLLAARSKSAGDNSPYATLSTRLRAKGSICVSHE